jgi:hypothetical protein
MTKDSFYRGKQVVTIEWWVSDCDLPRLVWARLRVFGDGTADACCEEGGTLFGFNEQPFAGYFLAEDEYRRFACMDEDDEREYGIRLAEIRPPSWSDRPDQPFEYLGTY